MHLPMEHRYGLSQHVSTLYDILTCSGPSRSYQPFRPTSCLYFALPQLGKRRLVKHFLTCYVQEPTDVFFHQMEQRSLSSQRLYPTEVLWRSSCSWYLLYVEFSLHESDQSWLALKQVQELFKMRTSGQLDAISSISPKKCHQSISNSFCFCFFWQNWSPIPTISDLVIETGEARPALRHPRGLAAQFAVDGSTDLSAHRFRSSGVRNVAIDHLLLSIATVEVESVGWHMLTPLRAIFECFYMLLLWKILKGSCWTCFIHLKGPCIPCTVIPRLSTIIDYPNPSPPNFALQVSTCCKACATSALAFDCQKMEGDGHCSHTHNII